MMLLLRIALLIALCGLTGCATMFSGSAPQAVSIMTEPEGVDIAIINMRTADTILKTQTPYTAMLERKDGAFQAASYYVILTKPGYIEENIEIRNGIAGWYWGNILFGYSAIVGSLIDGASGAMYSLDNAPIRVKLYPDSVEGRLQMAKDAEAKQKEEQRREDDLSVTAANTF